jgi:hypothetical protein
MSSDSQDRSGALDDGFFQTACDLDRALRIGLSRNQRIVLDAIREISWAPMLARLAGEPRPDPLPALINLSALARATKTDRSRLTTALARLLLAKIVRQIPAGYLINKRYLSWLDDNGKKARFDPDQLRWIREAKALVKRAWGTRAALLQTATPVANGNTPLLQNATTPVAECNTNCCELQHPHIEARAELELENREKRIQRTKRKGPNPTENRNRDRRAQAVALKRKLAEAKHG